MKKWKVGVSALVLLFVGAPLTRVVIGNRTPNIQVPPAPPFPSPNAFDTYQAAAKRLKRDKEIGESLFNADGKPNNPAAWTARTDLLAANRDALRLTRVGLTQEYRQPPHRSFYTKFPYLSSHRGLALLLTLDANNRFASGDTAGGTAACLDAIALGRQITQGGPILTRLVSIACQAVARRPLWQNLARLDASAARSSARRLETLTARRIPMSETLTEEKYALQASFGEMWSGKAGGGLPSGEAEEEDWTPPYPVLFYAIWPKQQCYDNITGYMDALIARSQIPFAERGPAPQIPRDMWSRIIAPVLVKAPFKQIVSEDTQNALLTGALAIRAFRVANGTFPAALSDTVKAGYLQRVPADPFAPAAAPLRYRRLGANAYVLYSIGPDGADNNGKAIDNARKTKNKSERYLVEPDSNGDIVAGVNVY